MEQIGEILKKHTPKPLEERGRGYWLNRFFPVLAKDWNGVDQLTRLRVGVALKQFPNWELPVLWSLCEDSANFAKFFWWKVKSQRAINKVKKPSGLKKKEKPLKNLSMFK